MSRPALEHPSERLPWYVNGTLEGEELRRVEEHLASCLACRREVDELRELRRQVKEASPAAPEAGLERLLAEVATERPRFRPRRGWFQPWMPAVAAAVLVAAVGVGLWQPWGREVPVEERAGEKIELLRPLIGPEEALPREAFVLRWEVVPEWRGARFAVTVTAEDLTPLAEARGLEGTEFQVPAEALVGLPAGAKIYWQVDALLPEGDRLRSRTFRVHIE